MGGSDPRQRGLFAAAWNLDYLSAAATAVDIVCLGSATGSQGMIYRKLAHAQPWLDHGGARVYPNYHVIAGLAAASGAKRIATDSSATFKDRRARTSKHGWPSALARQPVGPNPALEDHSMALADCTFSTKEASNRRCAIPPGATAAALLSARWEALNYFRPME